MKFRSSSGSLRRPQTTHNHSVTKKRLSHVCDQGYTDWVSDWSEAASALLGLITDFLRLQWQIFVFPFSRWIGDQSGTKSWPPGTKLRYESQEASDNVGLCNWGLRRNQEAWD